MLVALVALVTLAACGKKGTGSTTAEAGELDRWINKDLAIGLASLVDARRGLAALTDDDIQPDLRPALEDRLGRRLVVRLDRVLVDAKVATPPVGNEGLQHEVVMLATDYRAIAGEMLAAAKVGDVEGYQRARARLAEVDARYEQFDAAISKQMNKLAVDVVVPELPPLAPAPVQPPPREAFGCDGAPCPCTPATEVKTGEVVTACTLAKLVEIKALAIECDARPVTFHPDGRLRSCTASRNMMAGVPVEPGTEVVLAPDGSFASGILGGMIAADGFSCGPGPIRYAAGAITACTLLGAWTWGDATVPEKAFAVIGKDAAGATVLRYARLPDGVELCFDDQRHPVTPCKEP